MRKALFYLTYNGIYNFTNGIGTQTQLLLRGMECLYPMLTRCYGPFDLHVVCPLPDPYTWGYDPVFFQRQQQRLTALQGQLHCLPYRRPPHTELWDVATWHHLSAQAAHLIHQQRQLYDECLVICVDQPWLHTPHNLLPVSAGQPGRVQTLLVLYNTAFIRNAAAPDEGEMAWEQSGLARAGVDPTTVATASSLTARRLDARGFVSL